MMDFKNNILGVNLGFISIPAFELRTAGDFSSNMLNRGPIQMPLPLYEKWRGNFQTEFT